MVVVQLTGGLGNQLFQYAAAKALSLHHETGLLLDVSSFLREELPDLEVPRDFELYNFEGVTEKTINAAELVSDKKFSFLTEKRFERLLPKYRRSVFKEPFYHFDVNFFKSRHSVFLKGGWQSFKYFNKYSTEIAAALQLKKSIVSNVVKTEAANSNEGVVSVHVRRGDYLRKPIILEWHGIMDKEYYAAAFEQIAKKTSIKKVLYFSDEPDWVARELLPLMPGEIVSNTIAATQYEDFYLMQHCSHNIVANSSFSWWAAYLNPNPDKIVIAPKRWFNKAPYDTKDLIPENWIRI
jgi:Glycosyl transferase family 11